MKIIGLTGGIGSGKSTVARFFTLFGIPVYTADDEAKRLMHSPKLVSAITKLFGENAYINGSLNRKFIARLVFNDGKLLQKLNAIVHPAVALDFKEWVNEQQAPYVIREVAILFENNGQDTCDQTILVTAPLAVRMKRVMKRDKTDATAVRARMDKQWPDSQKIPLADFVIQNIDLATTYKRVKDIHLKLLIKS